VRKIVGRDAYLRRKKTHAIGFVTETCYLCDIIMGPCARLSEVANITVYETVTQLFSSENLDLLG
jgi:hypothetical protein